MSYVDGLQNQTLPNFDVGRDGALRSPMSSLARLIDTTLSMPVTQLLGVCVVFGAVFFNLVNVQVDKEVVKLDVQVMMKLAIVGGCAVYGILGIFGDPRVRRVLLSFPVFFVVLLAGLYFLSSFASIKPKHSVASTLSLVAVILMTVTSMVQLGLLRMLSIVFHAMSLFLVLSWLAYFAWPDVGVFMEPIAGGEFTKRMSGLAHPNTLGQFAGLTVVLGVVLFQSYQQRSLWRMVIIALAAAALLASLSRTSLMATMVALMFAYRGKLLSRWNLALGLGAAAGLLVSAMLMSTQVDFGDVLLDKLTVISKSGDAEELTSATGRSEIWSYTMQLIAQQPLTGYGAATSKYFLADYSLYTHNLLLNIAFSTGVFGGLIGLVMILQQMFRLIASKHQITNVLVSFIIVNGLFENVIFSILPGMPTILWIMALGWTQVAQINGGEDQVRELSLEERLA